MFDSHCESLTIEMLRPLRASLTNCSNFLGREFFRSLATAAEGHGPPRWYKEVNVVPNATEVRQTTTYHIK